MKYLELREELKKRKNLTESSLKDLVKKAQLWHNPMNFDRGEGIKKQFGWDKMFTDALNEEGHKYRFYFKFREFNMTDPDTVVRAFKECENFPIYSSIWHRHAPKEIKSKALYLLAISEMSVRGFKHEEMVLKALEEAGKRVRKASAAEDYYMSIDAWVNGDPVQIKSPATARAMEGVL